MSRKKNVIPDYESVTPFLKGQASKIFKEVVDQDKVLIVQKQNKPQNVIISYARYLDLKIRLMRTRYFQKKLFWLLNRLFL